VDVGAHRRECKVKVKLELDSEPAAAAAERHNEADEYELSLHNNGVQAQCRHWDDVTKSAPQRMRFTLLFACLSSLCQFDERQIRSLMCRRLTLHVTRFLVMVLVNSRVALQSIGFEDNKCSWYAAAARRDAS